ncbi:MAG: NADH-quinone oxidoreductase subunit L [Actinobacteria bacterium]|nr:NADH-quinone oxidoreductase subunit L [Actinomycetota bacterium]
MLSLVWLIPALPLAGFVFLLVAGRSIGEPNAGWIATAVSGSSFVATLVVFAGLLERDGENRIFEQVLFDWLPVGSLEVEAGFLVDPLSITMALFITGVGSLIHLYSIGYMHGDENYSKFFVYLNLFLFSMLMLVLGNNLVITFLGWEGVGACSYFLVSFWHTRESAATAGKKAFVTNRVGDWGFMLATFLLWTSIGTITYVDIGPAAGSLTNTTATAIALLFLVAAAGKSAQLPLYVWLPDAMEGPTPVSAMVHAATMVTSGVYLLVRMNPILTDNAQTVIAVVGVATALFAALAAVAQHDIKKVLAYSTVSQLGFMFLAIGSGAYVAAIFHVITHAFFKALLFLGSGSVIHGMQDEQDMRKMGALRKAMPLTAATFIVGWLAIAGVPPFAGFWSKDEILLAAWEVDGIGKGLWAVGLFTALLTAYYMSRQVFLVFFGEARWNDNRPQGQPEVVPHESSWTMVLPLGVLAVAAMVGGAINLPIFEEWLVLEHFLEPVFEYGRLHHFESTTATKVSLAVVAVIAGLVGMAIAAAAWLQKRIPTDRLEPKFLENAMYVDATYAKIVGGPGQKSFDAIAAGDQKLVDGAVNGAGRLVQKIGLLIQPGQSGMLRQYAIGIALGGLAIVVWLLSAAL